MPDKFNIIVSEEPNTMMLITESGCSMASNNSAEEKMLLNNSGKIFPARFLFENGC